MCLRHKPPAERFYPKVRIDESGCHIWTGYRDKKGYGKFNFDGKNICLAHRAAWILSGRVIPDETPCVLHKCDNPSCVNVEHLWLGTVADNNLDIGRKNRGSKGILFPYGVSRTDDATGKYFSRIKFKGKTVYLGRFDTIEKAHNAALEEKRRLYGLSE